ncbi:PAS domain S-box protein [Nocardioides panacis]|uniref:histidine kinase n=1 Tax=Nocardioides panacis TaxID=2849501 RepID=A0A975Y022_9ACTN|nr:PAS domain-containing protein [Nocardioides panacis]QWZ08000.1 PAS domain S-box protein [Nocardioides panacis]
MSSATALPFDGPGRPAVEADEPATPSTIPADVAQQVPAAVYTACTGADGAWLYASPQIEAILGYGPQEFVDDPGLWARLLHPEDRDWVLADEEAAHAPEVRRSYAEYRLIARDGRVVWVLDDITVLHEPGHGSVQHGLLFDITARKRTELLLAEQAALMEHIARGGTLAATLQALADSVLRVTGAQGCAVVVDPVDDGHDRDVRTYVAGATYLAPTAATERLAFADLDGVPLGHLVLLGLPAGPDLRSESGAPAVGWAGRIAALAVGRSRQEQREARSYSLLEATLESTADGILVVDGAGRIADFNRTFSRMWNIPPRSSCRPVTTTRCCASSRLSCGIRRTSCARCAGSTPILSCAATRSSSSRMGACSRGTASRSCSTTCRSDGSGASGT